MNLYLRRALTASIFIITLVLGAGASATVYVYEVTTLETRFQTASKLPPDAFMYYNGGFDIIQNLKVVARYADKDMAKALKDFNLENNNSNILIFTPNNRSVPKRPYYWWR